MVPVIFLLVFFLVAGFFAITQETGEADNPNRGGLDGGSFSMEDGEAGIEPEFIPVGPPRWFRSNAGGMTLEEIPSRLGALRNEYALVIDYVPPDELEPRLLPFYKDEYIIEIRILYKERKEIRRQWLLRDEAGNTRVNAVFRAIEDEIVPDPQPSPKGEGSPLDENELEETVLTAASMEADTETKIETADAQAAHSTEVAPSTEGGDHPELALADMEGADAEMSLEDTVSGEKAVAQTDDAAPDVNTPETRVPSGFIEVYNEKGQIARDYSLFEDGGEILTEYTYKGSALIKAETKTRDPYAGEYRKTHTDTYRYNRSYSLRNVERIFHEAFDLEPVLLVFPGRVLDAAYDKDFLKERLTLVSEFFGGLQQADDGFRMVYDTDAKGRVLSETLYNDKDEVVWTLKNTWVGDRISSIFKIEGEEQRSIEYDYDASGNRIAERDILNGVLERQVLINGAKETEELYLNGVVVIRAFWEDGRKISEERVRRR
ncbi:MAG: hypothetical protein LBC52_08155 [Treponema sp.]|nr:hypothetical protein [Treponema sp.]